MTALCGEDAGADSPSEVVVNRHLEDMRQIAFAKLNVDKPK